MEIRAAAPEDARTLAALRHALWPDGSLDEHAGELAAFFAGERRDPLAILVAVDQSDDLVGFAEISIHPYAEGCTTDRVGYLEGWYVGPAARHHGVGRALVEACERWAKAQGCTELASDTEDDNVTSIAAHLALGFTDAGVIRCFRKDL